MTMKVKIDDGLGRGYSAKVDKDGTLNAVIHPHPPLGDQISAIPFRQYFTDNGEDDGAIDMRVDGSVSHILFYIVADQDKDVYIKTISMLIADVNATLDKFGTLAALTNGLEFYYETKDNGSVVIQDALKSNFDFVRLALGNPSFGSGATAFQAGNIFGNSEGYIPVIDMEKIFGLQYGIRLRAGTRDRIVFKIRDNVTAIDSFNAIGYGIKI